MAFEGVTWQVCDLRFWLNGEFALAAFASAVSPFGSIRSDGYVVEYEGSSVRPDLWIGNTGA